MKDFEIYLEIHQDLLEAANETDGDRLYKEGQSVKAPEWMKAAVRRGRKIRDNQPPSNKCCKPTGLKRASQIENGENLSLKTIKRMKSFASRMGGAINWDDPESKGAQSMLIWGIPYSKSGRDKFIKWCDAQINKLEK